MANVNKVILIGRLTRDPEVRVFANGGKVANFGFATNNRKKNQTTGQWEDDPMFIDVKVFNRGENGKLADMVEQNLHKGQQVFLEGRLVLETWQDKQQPDLKRSKHVVYVDNFQYLEPRADGAAGGGGYQRSSAPRAAAPSQPMGDPGGYEEQDAHQGMASAAPDEDNIPF